MFKIVKHANDDRLFWDCPFCQDAPDDCDTCSVGCDESFWDGIYNSWCVYGCRYCDGTKLLSIEDLLKLITECYSDRGE